MEQKYIATYGITNSIGLGIIEINHTDGTVEFDGLVDGVVKDNQVMPIITHYSEDSDDLAMGFMWGAWFISLGECIRTGV